MANMDDESCQACGEVRNRTLEEMSSPGSLAKIEEGPKLADDAKERGLQTVGNECQKVRIIIETELKTDEGHGIIK